jgi:deoxycytidylate deaminase
MNENPNSELVHSELIIGLVAAVGTETALVVDLLKERLGCAGYCVTVVKVSRDVIPLLCEVPKEEKDAYRRIDQLMDAGNTARKNSGQNAILALGAATRIFASRNSDKDGRSLALSKTAVIVDSLKRPEEVEELRRIYPSGFVLMGVHATEERRVRHLTTDLGITQENAKKLIQRDREEIKNSFGQRVNKTFHLADFFVRVAESHDRLRCDIKRIVELWFGNPFITPTFDEHAMFLAFSSALRSADLSRQVGAVLARDSQVLATGANDCPRAGGGLYWPSRQSDMCISDIKGGRDHTREDGDSNRREQIRIIERIVEEGKNPEYGLDPEKLRALLEASRIRDLTEFGRVVHAEMEALLCCARNGLSTVGATLYSTTFPCHNCAKHIIAAGVKRVVFVEPYPKSKSLDFHNDAIAIDGTGSTERVEFVPFVGIGPRRFFDLFSMHLGSTYPLVRKNADTGKAVDWRIEQAQVRIQMSPVSYLELEAQACAQFGQRSRKPEENEKP